MDEKEMIKKAAAELQARMEEIFKGEKLPEGIFDFESTDKAINSFKHEYKTFLKPFMMSMYSHDENDILTGIDPLPLMTVSLIELFEEIRLDVVRSTENARVANHKLNAIECNLTLTRDFAQKVVARRLEAAKEMIGALKNER